MNKQKSVPTLDEFVGEFKRPNFFDDFRTPEEMKQEYRQKWYKMREDKYYELYGQENIESLRRIRGKERE